MGLTMFERAVLPAERAAGEYPLTLALLKLVDALLSSGAGAAPAMTPLLQHTLVEVLTQHGAWRYRRRADRWEMHATAAKALASALAPRPGPANAARRAAVAGFVAGDAGAASAALAPLALDAAALRGMHEEGAWRASEVAAAEDAVAATLALLPALLRALETNAETTAAAAADASAAAPSSPLSGGPLARSLLVEAPWGGPPLAAAVASYAAYPYAAACCPLALPALAALCAGAPAEPPLACALPSPRRAARPRRFWVRL